MFVLNDICKGRLIHPQLNTNGLSRGRGWEWEELIPDCTFKHFADVTLKRQMLRKWSQEETFLLPIGIHPLYTCRTSGKAIFHCSTASFVKGVTFKSWRRFL